MVVEEEGEDGGEGEAEAGAAGRGATRRSDLVKSRIRASSASQFTGGGEFGCGQSIGGEAVAVGGAGIRGGTVGVVGTRVEVVETTR